MEIIREFEELYAKASNGKTKYWKVEVTEDNGSIYIVKYHGYVDGTLTRDIKEITSGKNIGKANETSLLAQAVLEAQSAWNRKLDSKYTPSPEIDNVDDIVLPMLAHSYDKRGHNILWPAYTQPKLDGVRCLVHLDGNKVIYTSRQGKLIDTVHHFDNDIKQIFERANITAPGFYLDGELYLHGETFQGITRLMKKYRPGETEQIEYHIYDIIPPIEQGFMNRFVTRMAGFHSALSLGSNVKIVDTIQAHDESEMKVQHTEYCNRGYEGTIIRNMNGLYKKDHRSADLQKYKDFQEEDYEVIGVNEATGNDTGTAVFQCITPDGLEFAVRPKGTREQRREWFENKSGCIGKMLSVRFQELTEDRIPRFPVGLGFKNDR